MCQLCKICSPSVVVHSIREICLWTYSSVRSLSHIGSECPCTLCVIIYVIYNTLIAMCSNKLSCVFRLHFLIMMWRSIITNEIEQKRRLKFYPQTADVDHNNPTSFSLTESIDFYFYYTYKKYFGSCEPEAALLSLVIWSAKYKKSTWNLYWEASDDGMYLCHSIL